MCFVQRILRYITTFYICIVCVTESFKVEILVECIRSSTSPQTQRQALLLMASVAHLLPVSETASAILSHPVEISVSVMALIVLLALK